MSEPIKIAKGDIENLEFNVEVSTDTLPVHKECDCWICVDGVEV